MSSSLSVSLPTNIAYCEAKGLANCFNAYATYCPCEKIFEVGFNSKSGNIYISLWNGVIICSMLGREVEYLVVDFEHGKESFFNVYSSAVAFQKKLNA